MPALNATTEAKTAALYSNSIVLTTAGLVTTSALYGVYLVTFFSCMSILLSRKEGIWTRRLVLISAVVTLFLLSSAYLVATMSYFILGVRSLLSNDVGTLTIVAKNAKFIAKYHRLGTVGQVLFPVSVVIGDAIVVWRAWALSRGNKILMAMPILLQLALTGTAFAWVGCFVDAQMPIAIPPKCLKINTATYILSMLTNFAATAVMGYMSWSYRRAIRKYFNNCRHHQARAEKVLVLLFESGLVYTSLYIIQLAVLVAPSKSSFLNQAFRQVFSAAAAQLVGIYPTLIIVLVFLQRSLWDPSGKSTICDTDETPQASQVAGHDSMPVLQSKAQPGPLQVLLMQQENKSVQDDDSATSPLSA